MTSPLPDKYAQLYDETWRKNFAHGTESCGDFALSMEFIERTGLLRPEHHVLEIGCALGRLTAALHDKGFIRIIGTDIAPAVIELGRQRHPQVDLRSMDASRLAFDDASFDVCLSFDLVEHLPDVTAHFREVRRLLKPNGHYLFQTPNILSNALYETLRHRNLKWRAFHPSLQTAGSLRRKLTQAGFRDISFTKMSPVSEVKIKQVSPALRRLFTAIPWTRLPLPLQTNFYVTARRG